MELGNGMPNFIDPENIEVVRFEVKMFRWRLAKLFDPSSGEFVGLTIQLWPNPLPWFKINLPFLRLDARNLARQLTELLDEEITPDESDTETAS